MRWCLKPTCMTPRPRHEHVHVLNRCNAVHVVCVHVSGKRVASSLTLSVRLSICLSVTSFRRYAAQPTGGRADHAADQQQSQ